jgi:YesN/AraC family two-component response regulator
VKIVIVDDENVTLRWLKRTIETIDSGYHITGTFENGNEALEFCCNNEVDVLITDIRMPGMSGLQLLQQLISRGHKPYTVVLSAYDEFAYAKQAMSLGVSVYLLKPEITKEMLIDTLDEAHRTIRKLQASHTKQHPDASTLLASVLDGTKAFVPETLAERLQEENRSFSSKRMTLFLLHCDNLETLVTLLDYSREFLEVELPCHFCVKINQHLLSYLCCLPVGAQEDLICRKWYDSLSVFSKVPIILTFSNLCDSLQQLPQLYTQADFAHKYLAYYDGFGYIGYAQALKAGQRHTLKRTEESYHALVESINREDFLPIPSLFEEFVAMLAKYRIPVQEANRFLTSLCFELYHKKNEYSKTRNLTIPDLALLSEDTRFASKAESVRTIVRSLALSLVEDQQLHRYSQSIQEITVYLHEHFSQKITLEELASLVHLNRTYVSYLFKKETGKTISAFLSELRLENAAKQLATSSENINIIAESIGIQDFAYFCGCFKKQFGCTPTEYRKQHHRN